MKHSWPTLFVVAAIAILRMAEVKSDEADKVVSAADRMLGKDAGQVRDDNGLKMLLVWCPPGEFTMGSPDSEVNRRINEDQVEVILTAGFWFGKHEVTQAEWIQVMATEPWKSKATTTKEGDDFPATFVRWDDALEFCRKLTEQERKAGRLPNGWEYSLPTEGQWEYACRAGTKTKFSFGDDESKLSEYAWFRNVVATADEQYSHRGQKKPNQWGLYDMHGNLFEWCRDIYITKLPGGNDPEVKRDEKTGRSMRVFRGGGWTSGAPDCRSAIRGRNAVDLQEFIVGFRLALTSAH